MSPVPTRHQTRSVSLRTQLLLEVTYTSVLRIYSHLSMQGLIRHRDQCSLPSTRPLASLAFALTFQCLLPCTQPVLHQYPPCMESLLYEDFLLQQVPVALGGVRTRQGVEQLVCIVPEVSERAGDMRWRRQRARKTPEEDVDGVRSEACVDASRTPA